MFHQMSLAATLLVESFPPLPQDEGILETEKWYGQTCEVACIEY